MSLNDNPGRSWREIATELTREANTSRILELCLELNKALAEEEKRQGGALRLDDFKDSRRSWVLRSSTQ
jgi:hypothetical protein